MAYESILLSIVPVGSTLVGFWIAYKFSARQKQTEKKMQIRENFMLSYLDFTRKSSGFIHGIMTVSDVKLSDAQKMVWLYEQENEFTESYFKFMHNYVIMKLYFKDRKFDTVFADLVKANIKLEKLNSRLGLSFEDLGTFIKDKKELNIFIHELKEVTKIHHDKLIKVQDYVINMKC